MIGTVAVRDGEPIEYRGARGYEPFGRNGLMVLDPWLEARFVEEVLRVALAMVNQVDKFWRRTADGGAVAAFRLAVKCGAGSSVS
jgi:hypothetical protein